MNMNDERPTPETDAASRDGYTFCREDMRPAVEFCANLERQRDDAREQLKAMRKAIKIAYAALPFNQWEALAKLKPFVP